MYKMNLNMVPGAAFNHGETPVVHPDLWDAITRDPSSDRRRSSLPLSPIPWHSSHLPWENIQPANCRRPNLPFNGDT